MAYKIRPMYTLGTPGVGAVNGIGKPGKDGWRKMCTIGFGYYPDGSLAPNPGQQGFTGYLHRGQGRVALVCQASGEIFPESRIKQQWDGKQVGDVYYRTRPLFLDDKNGSGA